MEFNNQMVWSRGMGGYVDPREEIDEESPRIDFFKDETFAALVETSSMIRNKEVDYAVLQKTEYFEDFIQFFKQSFHNFIDFYTEEYKEKYNIDPRVMDMEDDFFNVVTDYVLKELVDNAKDIAEYNFYKPKFAEKYVDMELSRKEQEHFKQLMSEIGDDPILQPSELLDGPHYFKYFQQKDEKIIKAYESFKEQVVQLKIFEYENKPVSLYDLNEMFNKGGLNIKEIKDLEKDLENDLDHSKKAKFKI